jgi:hypothetical protein
MKTDQERTGATPGDEPNVGRKRRALKDTLMPDEPPKVLGLAIPLVAVSLVLLIVALRFVEYQDTVRVSLTLKPKESFGRAFGEAFLQQGEAAAVQAEQLVDIDLGGYAKAHERQLQAKVGEITAFETSSLYRVRIDLPPDFDVGSLASPPAGPIQLEAKILTQKKSLFDKLFGAFKVLSRDL